MKKLIALCVILLCSVTLMSAKGYSNSVPKQEKAIDKSTVTIYFQVKKNLDPWIEKYQKAINTLENHA